MGEVPPLQTKDSARGFAGRIFRKLLYDELIVS